MFGRVGIDCTSLPISCCRAEVLDTITAATEIVASPAPPVARMCALDQSECGADVAHGCQAVTTSAAADHGQVTNACASGSAVWVARVSELTTPKLPPPPRNAQ